MPIVQKTNRKLDEVIFPGMSGVRFMPVFKFFIKGIMSEDTNLRASAVAYNFFLALFPATIFFFTLIAYLPIKDLDKDVLQFMNAILPNAAYETVRETLTDILKSKKGGLLSLGFVLALYFSSNGISTLIVAFNKYTHSVESRTFVKSKLVSIGLTFYVSALLIITLVISTAGTFTLKWLEKKGWLTDSISIFGLQTLKWVFSCAFIYILISSLYYFGPSKKRRWSFFNAGSTLAALLSLLTTYGFTLYVNHFDSYNKLYGSIGTLLVVMLLIFFNSMMLIIGFELNVSIDRALSDKIEADRIKLVNLEKNRENAFRE